MPDFDGELTADDVAAYTKGRLSEDDDETSRMLNTALAAARRYCGWRVTPVKAETVVMDGPGSRALSLPTMRVVTIDEIIEDGEPVDLAHVQYSPLGLVRKRTGARWSDSLGGISVTMTHGFADAPDWQAAVLELVDRLAGQVGAVAGNSGPLVEKTVDDVSYRWILTVGRPENRSLFDMLNHTLLDPYRLEPLS